MRVRSMTTRTFVLITLSIAAAALALGRPVSAQTIQFDPPILTGATTKAPAGFAVGDFNEDGKLDLVRTDPVRIEVLVFLGNGQGAFTRGFSFGAAGPADTPTRIAAADINGDGHQDLVIVGNSGQHLFVATGNGDGTFQSPLQSYPAPALLGQLRVADLNGDGWPDIVGAFNQSATSGIAIYLNDGHGALVDQPSIALGTAPSSVVVADFTGDHVPDVAMASTAGFAAGASVIAFQGAGDGTFSPGTPYATSAPATSIAAADFTGDGVVDLAVSQGTNSQGPAGLDLFVGRNDAASFYPAVFTAGPIVSGLNAADLNQDGRPDIAATGARNLMTFETDIEGNFESPLTFSTNDGGLAVMGDFNNDGRIDGATMDGAITALIVVLNSTPAVPLGPGQAVTWINPVNVAVNGGSLTKSSGCDGCFDASASSQQAIDGTTDSGLRFIAAHDPLLAVGLSKSANATSLDAIDFAIRPQGGYAEVRESGVYRKDIAFNDGDEFRILIQGTTVRYLKNNAPFYVSSVAPSYPLYAAALIASAGGTVSSAQMFGVSGTGGDGGGGDDGGGGGVTWGSTQNVTVDGAQIVKTSGCDGCFDASAIGADQIEGDGFLEFTVDDTAPLLMAGLTSAFTSGDPSSIDFGIRLQGGDAEIREHGIYKTDVLFHTGDIFRISVTGGVVTYALNGAVFYSSDVAPSGPVFAAIAIASAGGSVSNVSIGGVSQ